jgi:hypothetical protein
MRNQAALVFWSTAALVGLGVASFYSVRSIVRMRQASVFNQQIDRFLVEPNKPSGEGRDSQTAPTPPAARVGKLLPINLTTQRVDDILFELPLAMQPHRVEDVRLVALLQWSQREICPYVDSRGKATTKLAIQHSCHVRVIDLASQRVLGEEEIAGALPPDRIRSRESSQGPQPVTAVADYLRNLAQP